MNQLMAACTAVCILIAGCGGPRESGPAWESTGGPIAQNVSCIVPDEHLSGFLYAGLSTGELYRSVDGGEAWERFAVVQANAMIYRIVQDPEGPGRLMAATSGGLFLSTNGGKDWSRLPLGGESVGCLSLAIDPWKPSVLYAGTRGRGIFKSVDAGASWSQLTSPTEASFTLSDIYDVAIDVQTPDIVYAAASGFGIMRSTDAGAAWTRLTPNVTSTAAAATHLALSPASGDQILYGTASGSIFRSMDRGASWAASRQGLEGDRILSLTLDPRNPRTVLAGTGAGIVRSTDFGTTWEGFARDLPPVGTSVTVSAGKSNPVMYAFGEGLGVRASSDSGHTWRNIDAALGGSSVRSIAVNRTGTGVYAVIGSAVLQFDRTSGAWVPASMGLMGGGVNALAFDPDSTSVMFAATPAGLYGSRDSGHSWRPGTRRLSISPLYLETHPAIGTRLYASGEEGLFVSTDRGNSWGQVKPLGSRFAVRSMTFMPTNAGLMFATGPTGLIGSTDGGFSWAPSRFGSSNSEPVAVTLGAGSQPTWYVWTSSGEGFRSTNMGLEWTPHSAPWPLPTRLTVAFDRYRPSSAIALAGGSQLFVTDDGGAAWTPVRAAGPPPGLECLVWNAATRTLYGGTQGLGVYRLLVTKEASSGGAR